MILNPWMSHLALPDLKAPSPSHDLRPVMTIDVGRIPVPEEDNLCIVMALGLLGMFPRLKIKYSDDYWEDIGNLVVFFQRMGRSAFS